MMCRSKICLVAIVLSLIPISCTELPGPPTARGGDVVLESVPESGSLPLAWGDLVSVSNSPDFPEWFQLWLQDDQGSIRMVAYDIQNNRLSSHARVITRKTGGGEQ